MAVRGLLSEGDMAAGVRVSPGLGPAGGEVLRWEHIAHIWSGGSSKGGCRRALDFPRMF